MFKASYYNQDSAKCVMKVGRCLFTAGKFRVFLHNKDTGRVVDMFVDPETKQHAIFGSEQAAQDAIVDRIEKLQASNLASFVEYRN